MQSEAVAAAAVAAFTHVIHLKYSSDSNKDERAEVAAVRYKHALLRVKEMCPPERPAILSLWCKGLGVGWAWSCARALLSMCVM